MMDLPGLGPLTDDDELPTWARSGPVDVPMLGRACTFRLVDYDDSEREPFAAAVASLLAATPDVLTAATADVFRYYQDLAAQVPALRLTEPAAVWAHVRPGGIVRIRRRRYGERGVYASIDFDCDWDREHGLELVLCDGQRITKLGPRDGHVSNADAYGEPRFEDVVYVSLAML